MPFNDKFYAFFSSLWNFEKKQRLVEIDFEKPWWHIVKPFVKKYILVVCTGLLEITFLTTLPIVFTVIIQNQDFNLLYYTTFAGVVVFCLRIWGLHINTVQLQQSNKSIFYTADKFFLTVDPIAHATKSSGQIISKVDRGAAAIIDIDAILTFDIYPVIFGLLTVIVTFFTYNIQLGLVTLIILSIIIAINVFTRVFGNSIYQSRIISADDKAKSDSVESLQQAPYIRSIFATIEQDAKIRKSLKNAMTTTSNYWQFAALIDMLTYIAYLISVAMITGLLLYLVRDGSLTTITAIGLITTYIAGTKNIVIIGSRIRRLLEAEFRLRDLFNFIKKFGKKSFPVI
jgi:ABC-type multidrug transport system fused ATPase/permease subunit